MAGFWLKPAKKGGTAEVASCPFERQEAFCIQGDMNMVCYCRHIKVWEVIMRLAVKTWPFGS